MYGKCLWKKLVCFLVVLVFSLNLFFAAEPTVTIEPYTKDEIPTWAKDLRRTEIVTLGSLPFVTIGVTLGYSFYRVFSNGMDFGYFINPLSSSASSSLTEDEQKGLILSSLAVSALIGLTDLTINLIQRKVEENKKVELEKGSVTIESFPVEEGYPEQEEGSGEEENSGHPEVMEKDSD